MAYFVHILAALIAIANLLIRPRVTENGKERWSRLLWLLMLLPVLALIASSFLQVRTDREAAVLLQSAKNAEAESRVAERQRDEAAQKLDIANKRLLETQGSILDLSEQLRVAERQRDEAAKQLDVANDRLSRHSTLLEKLVRAEEQPVHKLIVELGGKVLSAEGGHITGVSLENTLLTDSQLSELGRLSRLRELDLRKTQITNRAINYLPAFENLQVLYLNSCGGINSLEGIESLSTLKILELDYLEITDDDLAHLSRQYQLEELSLYCVESISDEGLKHLNQLSALTDLNLCGTKVTDKGLEKLTTHQDHLEVLWLSWCDITDEGLESLQRFSRISQLWLGYTEITDQGLRHLQQLERLFNLQIRHTAITDDGLEYLGQLQNLRHLNLEGTRVSDAGVARLQQTRPDLTLNR